MKEGGTKKKEGSRQNAQTDPISSKWEEERSGRRRWQQQRQPKKGRRERIFYFSYGAHIYKRFIAPRWAFNLPNALSLWSTPATAISKFEGADRKWNCRLQILDAHNNLADRLSHRAFMFFFFFFFFFAFLQIQEIDWHFLFFFELMDMNMSIECTDLQKKNAILKWEAYQSRFLFARFHKVEEDFFPKIQIKIKIDFFTL